MWPTQKGALRLFQFAGVQVYLHWSWFIVALIEFNNRRGQYSSPLWNVAEYLALFAIVLLHEFGHALACRQTGGSANTIVLWPLGGVAYVSPPPRPGATLWSIAAGPLVNLLLLPISFGLAAMAAAFEWTDTQPNLTHFFSTLVYINTGLLIFNLMPVYPLDGGQILRSLLWFVIGPWRSLMVATAIGLAGAVALGALALINGSLWVGLIALFMGANCWRALQHARLLRRVETAPVRHEFLCPGCQVPPPEGPFWVCYHCRTAFDTFAAGAVCPNCQHSFPATHCPRCGTLRPIAEWHRIPPRLGDARTLTL